MLWIFDYHLLVLYFSSVTQLCPTLCDPMGTTAHEASLSITNSWSLLTLMSIESVMPSNHLILNPSYCLSLLFFGTLHANGYIFLFLLYFSHLFFSQLFVKPPRITILPFCISFSWGWSQSLPPVQCHEPMSIVLQALCRPDLIPWIYFSLPLYNHKGFDLGHTWMV